MVKQFPATWRYQSHRVFPNFHWKSQKGFTNFCPNDPKWVFTLLIPGAPWVGWKSSDQKKFSIFFGFKKTTKRPNKRRLQPTGFLLGGWDSWPGRIIKERIEVDEMHGFFGDPPLKLTASLPLKMDGWTTIVSFWGPACLQGRTCC